MPVVLIPYLLGRLDPIGSREALGLVVLVGLGHHYAVPFLSSLALNYTTVIRAEVIFATMPVISLFASAALLGRKLSGPLLFWSVVSIAGVMCLFLPVAMPLASQAGSTFVGDVLILVAVTVSVLAVMASGRLVRMMSVISVLCYSIGVGTLAQLWVLGTHWREFLAITLRDWILLGYIALIGVFLANLLLIAAVRHVSAVTVGGANNLVPLFGSALAVAFLGESLKWNAVVACLLVLLSVYRINQHDQAGQPMKRRATSTP